MTGHHSIPVLVALLALSAGCASEQSTISNSQAEAIRIVTLCSGGLSNELSAKLSASYVKYSSGILDGRAAADAKGIIFSDSFTKDMTGAEKITLTDNYVKCMQTERAR